LESNSIGNLFATTSTVCSQAASFIKEGAISSDIHPTSAVSLKVEAIRKEEVDLRVLTEDEPFTVRTGEDEIDTTGLLTVGGVGEFRPVPPKKTRTREPGVFEVGIDDFKDIETWKGVWFTLNYLVKLEATERGHVLADRLSHLPGVSTLADLKEMLQDTPPEEFLNPETWKGMWFLVNYELRNTAGGMKRRFLGEQTAEDEE